MTPILRRVREVRDAYTADVEAPPADLASFRGRRAWVLLGEPGAGKTTALQAEAEQVNGKLLRVVEFLEGELEDDWRDKTLFLDGLDETRAGTKEASVVQRLASRLKRLGRPPFRLACRAADWYGSSDKDELAIVSSDAALPVLRLEPLSDEDILELLGDGDSHVRDPVEFTENARRLGVEHLLGNPQTLRLLARSVHDGGWPRTREETYELACKSLAAEPSKRHRNLARSAPRSAELILDAAGQLCAVLLLANKSGIALDRDRVDSQFVELADCGPTDLGAAAAAVGSRLFSPAPVVERVVPSHRSVAEYLAGRWLALRLQAGLPLARLMNLLVGRDGRTVAGLRGLYAWLALHSPRARGRMIDADPLTVVLYGDAGPMQVSDKRRLLAGLRREAEGHIGFLNSIRDGTALGGLVATELRGDFLAVLRASERDDASQAYLSCLLQCLEAGDALTELADAVLGIARADSYRADVRLEALRVWLKWAPDRDALDRLIGDLFSGRVSDPGEDLIGALLRHLYPARIGAAELLGHLRPPQEPHLLGLYRWFLHSLASWAPPDHVPVFLDELVGRADRRADSRADRSLRDMAGEMLARGIVEFGDRVDDERLFAWLGLGLDEYGEPHSEAVDRAFSDWVSTRPERYKSLLALAFLHCAGDTRRLRKAPPPADIGSWHFDRVEAATDETLAQLHLQEAVNREIDTLSAGLPTGGLLLRRIEDWAAADPNRQRWLRPLLAREVPDWRLDRIAAKKARADELQEQRRERRAGLEPHRSQIEAGTARVDIMNGLARLWAGRLLEVRGDTPLSRFEQYCDDGRQLLAEAEAGFRRCPLRSDLPTTEEIVDLALARREHFIRLPCLIGMDLRWEDGASQVDTLPEEALRRMVAFRLTGGTGEETWFVHLKRQRPGLVADVLTLYAGAALKAGVEYVSGIDELEIDRDRRELTRLAVPRLLAAFPLRARASHLRYLEHLLRLSLTDSPEDFASIVDKKLSARGMDAGQRVYWLAAATLRDPGRYEAALWRHVGRSEVRAAHLSRFLRGRTRADLLDWPLSAHSTGMLVERIVPHATVVRPAGVHWVSEPMERGDHVRNLIARLGSMASAESELEIERLLGSPSMRQLRPQLELALQETRQLRREREFTFPSVSNVARVLANGAPTSNADLAALTLDLFDDIANELRHENDDGVRAFWNIERNRPPAPREENLCRNELLRRLRGRLEPMGVACEPEADYAHDNRADLRVSFRTGLEFPIEIKRDRHRDLWQGLRRQLIEKYASGARARGFGLYVVLWFGGSGIPQAIDGGKKPRSPEELRARLEARLDAALRDCVFVRVLDVTLPQGAEPSDDLGTLAPAP